MASTVDENTKEVVIDGISDKGKQSIADLLSESMSSIVSRTEDSKAASYVNQTYGKPEDNKGDSTLADAAKKSPQLTEKITSTVSNEDISDIITSVSSLSNEVGSMNKSSVEKFDGILSALSDFNDSVSLGFSNIARQLDENSHRIESTLSDEEKKAAEEDEEDEAVSETDEKNDVPPVVETESKDTRISDIDDTVVAKFDKLLNNDNPSLENVVELNKVETEETEKEEPQAEISKNIVNIFDKISTKEEAEKNASVEENINEPTALNQEKTDLVREEVEVKANEPVTEPVQETTLISEDAKINTDEKSEEVETESISITEAFLSEQFDLFNRSIENVDTDIKRLYEKNEKQDVEIVKPVVDEQESLNIDDEKVEKTVTEMLVNTIPDYDYQKSYETENEYSIERRQVAEKMSNENDVNLQEKGEEQQRANEQNKNVIDINDTPKDVQPNKVEPSEHVFMSENEMHTLANYIADAVAKYMPKGLSEERLVAVNDEFLRKYNEIVSNA